MKEFTYLNRLDWAYIESFVRKLTTKIFEDYEIQEQPPLCIFKNTKKTYHKKFSFVYGRKLVAYRFIHGYKEYASILYQINGARKRVTGLECIYYIAIHECAHALQWQRNGRLYRSVHNRVFVNAMNELLSTYAFEAMRDELLDLNGIERLASTEKRARDLFGYDLQERRQAHRVQHAQRRRKGFVKQATFQQAAQVQAAAPLKKRFDEEVAGSIVTFKHTLEKMFSIMCEDMQWGYTTHSAENRWYYNGKHFVSSLAVAEHAMNDFLNT